MTRALWNTHGMVKDVDECMDAAAALGLLPEELDALADRCRQEADIAFRVARYEKGQDKRKRNLIAKYYKIRARRFKELAALTEQEMTEDAPLLP
jgi:uncharacterized protein Yka (UPF0111/DUF47 family)